MQVKANLGMAEQGSQDPSHTVISGDPSRPSSELPANQWELQATALKMQTQR